VGPRAGLNRCRKSRPPTGIQFPDHPARSQSLYRLSYPSHLLVNLFEIIIYLQCHKLASIPFFYSISDTVKPVMSDTVGFSQIRPTYTGGQVIVNTWQTVQLSLVRM
jgi:hypothetical protein